MSDEGTATAKSVNYIREGFHTITPYIAVHDVMGLIEFVKQAFDAEGRSSIWSISAKGGVPRLLVHFDDPARPSSRPEFATDGKRFFFTLGQRQSDVWTVDLIPAR